MARLQPAAVAVLVLLGLEAAAAQPNMRMESGSKPPEISVAVYGSATFQDGFSVGSHQHQPSPGSAAVTLAGSKAALVLHDRKESEFSEETRWALFSAQGKLRSHRRGNQGGIMLDADTSRILKDLDVGGTVKSNGLSLQGTGNSKPDADTGEAVLIGEHQGRNLRFGYDTGHTWIQSGSAFLALNPLGKNAVCVGTTTAHKKFTVGGGHLRVTKKLYVGDTRKAYISGTKLQFAHGGSWQMTDDNAMSTDVPVSTKGSGFFTGNVGIGTEPKFPTMKLQVHGGPVLVTDKADRGLSISQTKGGALLRSWNLDRKSHEALLIEGAPLLIQPTSGSALFGTTVSKPDMKIHVHGNMYVHGHMYAPENLHVRDHAMMDHLVMPSLSLKNEPQSPDGDTLVLGHTKMSNEGSSGESAWEGSPPKKVLTKGINLRLGYHRDYTWIQVHGKENGHHHPLALNPLGNGVAIGSTSIDKRFSFYAKGSGYVLGTSTSKMALVLNQRQLVSMPQIINPFRTKKQLKR